MKRCKINMGCGPRNFGNDWIHIDGGDYPHLDYSDITKLEFDDESIDLIYASHVIEYFDDKEVASVLEEWRRALRIGGILRLSVPDFEKIVEIYTHHGPLLIGPLYGRMEMNGEYIYHRTVYDEIKLRNRLRKYGFKDVKLWDWRETEHSQFDDFSQAYIPHMDKENGVLISLNIEAVK